MRVKLDKPKSLSPDEVGVRLSDARVGRVLEVVRVHGDDAFRGKMMALGIVSGARLRVTQGGGGGPAVLALSSGRVLLDNGSTTRVIVSHTGEDLEGRAHGLAAGGKP